METFVKKKSDQPGYEPKKSVNRLLIVGLFVVIGLFSAWVKFTSGGGKVTGWLSPLTMSFAVGQSTQEGDRDTTRQTERLIADISAKTALNQGTYGWYVWRLGEEKGYGANEEAVFPAVSIMKVPIMTAVHKEIDKGTLTLEGAYPLQEADKRYGSGPLELVPSGRNLTVARMLEVMGKNSDNTAPVILSKLVGWETVKTTMRELGMETSDFENNTVTAKDVARMWAALYKGGIVSEQQREVMWENLKGSIYEDRIPKGVPEGTVVVHKVGTDINVWADAGIVFPAEPGGEPFVIVILNDGVKRDEAVTTVPAIVKMIWDYETARSSKTKN